MLTKKVIFSSREPIGSSTYPMPSEAVDYPKQLECLNQPVEKAISTLYIHIPFCDQICSFCGFNKFVSTEEKKENYIRALLKEINLYSKQNWVMGLDIQAVYLGGGTPNSLSADQLDQILSAVHASFNLSPNCEITCEGTPQNFTDERIFVLKKHKVSRVSAGIQTVNQTIRTEHLHMRHSETEILEFIKQIRNNFENFNLDFIYNLPKQTKEIYQHDLEIALESQSSHLTIYPLVLLENTRFYTDYVKLNKLEIPSEEKEIEFFNLTLERLSKTEFNTYSIRDWSKPNKECKYIYLNAKSNQVLALGAGSHGYLAGTTYRNERNLTKYSQLLEQDLLPIDLHKICSESELQQRFMVMGLRLFNLDMAEFNTRFGCDWQNIFGQQIQDLVSSGYLEVNNNLITHTLEGHIWANNIRTYFEGQKGKSVGYSDSLGIDVTGKSHYSTISRVKASADVEAHH